MTLNRIKDSVIYFLSSHIHQIILAIIVGFAFFVRYPWIFTDSMGTDESLYAWCGQRLITHPSLIFSEEILGFHPPLFPLCLALGHLVFPVMVSDRLVVLIISLIGIVFIYHLGKRISSWFVGLFCALNLAFNYNYLINSITIYIDVVQVAFAIILLLVVLPLKTDSSVLRDIAIGIVLSCLFLLKWTGMIFLPFVVLCYFQAPGKELAFYEKLKKLSVPMTMTGIFIVWYYLDKFLVMGKVLPDIHELVSGGVHPRPFHYYFANLHNILLLPPLLPFFVYGTYVLIKKNSPYKNILLFYFLIFITGLSIPMVKNLRYTLPLLPPMLIITGLGIEHAVHIIFKRSKTIRVVKYLILTLIGLMFTIYWPKTYLLIKVNLSTSTGLAEAGEWIKSRITPNTLLIAQNHGPIRYFTQVNYQNFGGQLFPLPSKKRDFEDLLALHPGHTLIVVDLWSESVPSEFSPFWRTKEDDEYFRKFQFQLVKIIYRDTYAYNGRYQKNLNPVVKIFERGYVP